MPDFYLHTGSTIKNYEVVDVIGSGFTSVVYVCLDRSSGRKIAVKRFYPDKMNAQLEARIHEEPKLKIKSNYVVKGEESFTEGDIIHLVMPYVEGKSLREVLDANGRIDIPLAVYTSICLAIAACDLSAARIISSDIKTENIMITKNGIVKLIDLGCFERIGKKAEISMGTWPFCAPELINHEVLYESTDVYSIGVVFLEMITEPEEFKRETDLWEVNIKRGIKHDLSFLKKPFPEAAHIIGRALEPNPKKRYKTAKELHAELLVYYNSIAGNIKEKALFFLLSNGKRLVIKKGKNTIGRNLIDPSNPYISANHLIIDFDGYDLKVCDNKSVNGTAVNGTRIGMNWVNVRDTDVIQMANVSFQVRLS